MSTRRLEGAPRFFGGGRLFGWYHAPASPSRACGVALVSPIGTDQTRSHRGYRHLALRLAAAGFPVLRFDLRSTGDSADLADETRAFESWREDVSAAVEELRAQSGAKEIALVGLRLGATIAMTEAAARGDIASLVLWGPCASGKNYVKEVLRMHKAYAMLEPDRFVPGPQREGGKEALGFFLSNALVGELEKFDLLKIEKRAAERALVISTEGPHAEDALIAQLKKTGAETAHAHIPGYKFLVQTPRAAELPEKVLQSIVGFLSEHHLIQNPPAPSVRESSNSITLPDGSTEQTLIFGSRHALFGLWTRPATPSQLPAILFTNAGCINRSGAQRNHTVLARRWAALGFNTLRFDLSGIGDSQTADGVLENEVFPTSGSRDISDAMDALRAACGVDRFVMVGLCSGGDFAFRAAYEEERVVGAVLMNPRTFFVNDNEVVEAYAQGRYYQSSMMQKDKWLKLLKGQVNVRQVAAKVIPKVKDAALKRVRRVTGRLLAFAGRKEEVPESDIPGRFRAMAERGVDTVLVVSTKDPGIDYVDSHFKEEMKALRSLKGFRREDVPGADHSFTALWSQDRVHDLVTEHLTKHWLR